MVVLTFNHVSNPKPYVKKAFKRHTQEDSTRRIPHMPRLTWPKMLQT